MGLLLFICVVALLVGGGATYARGTRLGGIIMVVVGVGLLLWLLRLAAVGGWLRGRGAQLDPQPPHYHAGPARGWSV